MFNSKCLSIADPRRRGHGVSLCPARGTTQTVVKVPKYPLSVIGRKISVAKDSGEVGLEAAILQKVRNSLPIEVTGSENGRG